MAQIPKPATLFFDSVEFKIIKAEKKRFGVKREYVCVCVVGRASRDWRLAIDG